MGRLALQKRYIPKKRGEQELALIYYSTDNDHSHANCDYVGCQIQESQMACGEWLDQDGIHGGIGDDNRTKIFV